MEPYNKTAACLYCGKTFEKNNKHHKYCSSRCKEAYRIQKLELLDGVCKGCGKPIKYKLVSGKPSRVYCCSACQLAHTVPVKQLTCVDCGAEFEFKGRTTKLRCDKCWKKHRSNLIMIARALKDPTVQIGVGSGGAQNHDTSMPDDMRNEINSARRVFYAAHIDDMRVAARARYRDKLITGSNSCSICGYDKHQEALVVHHKNMDRSDNADSNLVVLCSNCHVTLHKLIRQKQKHEQISAVGVYEWFREAEVKSRNEAEKPDGAIRTEGCAEAQSGATHTITSSPDMRWHEAATEQE